MRTETRKEEEKGKNENLGYGNESGIGDSEDRDFRLDLKNNKPAKAGMIFDKSDWLTTKEAAIYLRKFEPNGAPSVNAIHKLVARGSIRRRKFSGRLFFRKKELDFLIESSVA